MKDSATSSSPTFERPTRSARSCASSSTIPTSIHVDGRGRSGRRHRDHGADRAHARRPADHREGRASGIDQGDQGCKKDRAPKCSRLSSRRSRAARRRAPRLFSGAAKAGIDRVARSASCRCMTAKPFIYVFNVDEDVPHRYGPPVARSSAALVAPADAVFLNAKLEVRAARARRRRRPPSSSPVDRPDRNPA